jgi:hypothetical protein
LKEQFELGNYDGFELTNDGRYEENPKLQFQEKFTLKSLVGKAGKNYLFDAGKFIGSQFALEEKDLKREVDIYLSYPRTITNKLILNVPEGYAPQGLEDFNVNVDNQTGSFISSAKLEGNKVVINTVKTYKTIYEFP